MDVVSVDNMGEHSFGGKCCQILEIFNGCCFHIHFYQEYFGLESIIVLYILVKTPSQIKKKYRSLYSLDAMFMLVPVQLSFAIQIQMVEEDLKQLYLGSLDSAGVDLMENGKTSASSTKLYREFETNCSN